MKTIISFLLLISILSCTKDKESSYECTKTSTINGKTTVVWVKNYCDVPPSYIDNVIKYGSEGNYDCHCKELNERPSVCTGDLRYIK